VAAPAAVEGNAVVHYRTKRWLGCDLRKKRAGPVRGGAKGKTDNTLRRKGLIADREF